ncbi:sugar ABC transporter substrate-binding protein [Phyllobacterium sophorae]|uniref:sugar ABC transporter substrate-binding protein n=1 Tax=Phyllobacterium sophorae TaxID=1520277 RepID=UPI00147669D6|nr:substrate-binding domain-containing protein [Phyllobacterium sophorae]
MRKTLGTFVVALLASASAVFAQDMSVDNARQPLTAWPGPALAVKVDQPKVIFVVTCSSQGIGCVRAANGVTAAGAALGWNVQVIDGRGDPGAWNGAILSAIAAKADGIVLAAVPPMLVGDALERARGAGISVVSVFNPLPDKPGSLFAWVRPDHEAQGRIAASWVIKSSAGTAKVILVEDNEFPELAQRVKGFRETLSGCSGCSIVENVESTIGTMAQRLPGAVASALSRHPDASYLVAPFDSNAFFAAEGVRQAGRSGAVKVTGYEGDPQAIAAIHSGVQAMTIANPAEWMGWQAADELARAFAGEKAANISVPFRLIDAENAPQTAGWTGDLDYEAQFRKIWGKP